MDDIWRSSPEFIMMMLLGILIIWCSCCQRRPVGDQAGQRRAAGGDADEGGIRADRAQLPYFPYAPRSGGRASEKSSTERLVCAICLEQLQRGELCSEVPACRHVFHRDCVGSWMKKSDSCPLCRVKISSWIAGPTESPTAADAV
uniref:RING-type E3 ubiquitin transferase n=1 Tax=Oryza glumipatula TaxID=40148 RepID=A0A0E0A7U2_9ORYZ